MSDRIASAQTHTIAQRIQSVRKWIIKLCARGEGEVLSDTIQDSEENVGTGAAAVLNGFLYFLLDESEDLFVTAAGH
jgi:hypothetical protein